MNLVPFRTVLSGRDSPPAGFQPYVQPRCHSAHPKQASRFEGFPTRAHVLGPSVTYFVRSANRTHGAGHMGLHTHTRLENPSGPNSLSQPSFCPSAGSARIHRGVYGPGLTRADAHVAVSCEAQHGPHARCSTNPARSPKQLRLLLGLCPSSVAVVVALSRTHSCVSRRLHTIP